jgi:hypothetical protein
MPSRRRQTVPVVGDGELKKFGVTADPFITTKNVITFF